MYCTAWQQKIYKQVKTPKKKNNNHKPNQNTHTHTLFSATSMPFKFKLAQFIKNSYIFYDYDGT